MEERIVILPRDYWDDIAERWDALLRDKYLPNYYYYKTADIYIQEAVAGLNNILELGCGTGESTKNILENQRTIVAIDYSKPMINLAKRRFSGHKRNGEIYLVLCDANILPFKNSSFDAIVSRGALLSYVKNPSVLLKESFRVLKKDSIIVLDAMNYNEFVKERERIWLSEEAVLDLIPCKDGVQRKLTRGGVLFCELRGEKLCYIFFRKYDCNKMQIREKFILKEDSPLVKRFKRDLTKNLRSLLVFEKLPEDLMESTQMREVLFANYFTPEDIRRLLLDTGFTDVLVYPLGHLCEITILRRLQYTKLFDLISKNIDLFCILEKILGNHLKLDTAWQILAIAKKS